MTAKIDGNIFKRRIKKLQQLPELSMKATYPYYRSKTPIRSGNARNKTKRNGLVIRSNYAYAGRLDEGWSNQAPNGFTDPSIDYLENFIEGKVGKI